MTDDHLREHGSIEATLKDYDRRLTRIEQLVSRMVVVTIGAVLTTIGTVVAAILIGGVNVLGA